MTTTLFGQIDEVSQASSSEVGPFAGVALENAIDRVLDYRVGPALVNSLQVGQRVRVPLGKNNRPARGYVVSIHAVSTFPKTQPILDIEAAPLLVSLKMLELARWMSRYYVTPLGMVLQSVIPSAVKKQKGLGHNRIVRLAKDRDQTQAILEETKSAKRRAILARLLLTKGDEGIELFHLAAEAATT